MNDFLAVASSWYALPLGVLIVGITLGFLPGVLLALIVRLYPKGSPRRAELTAELYTIPFIERGIWVFQALEIGVREGCPARYRCAKDKRSLRRRQKVMGFREWTWREKRRAKRHDAAFSRFEERIAVGRKLHRVVPDSAGVAKVENADHFDFPDDFYDSTWVVIDERDTRPGADT